MITDENATLGEAISSITVGDTNSFLQTTGAVIGVLLIIGFILVMTSRPRF